jgi:glycolate oxidase iron-sulfur subunit
MQTRFTPEQLADHRIAEADAILRSCERFGFCTAGCPTYVLLGNENDGPRGRIDLIRAMLEQGGAPDPKTVSHLDRCLSCMSCMTTCAVQVDYLHLIDRARAHIERHHRRSWDERLVRALLAQVLTRPRWFEAALRLVPLGRRLLVLAPDRLKHRLRPLLELAGEQGGASGIDVAAGDHRASTPRRGRVLLLAGCAQRVLQPSINRATVRLLTRAGFDVTIPASAGCCGSLSLHMGRESAARLQARRNIDAWDAELAKGEVGAIIVNASGCGSTVKDYAHLLRDEPGYRDKAGRIAALARDVSEFLACVDLGAPDATRRYAVACHDACSLRNVQRVTKAPRALLERAGYVVREIPEGHFCCGSAGTYNLLQPAIARQLGERKASNVAGTDAAIVCAGNVGCIVQMSRFTVKPVVHTVELLDWAYGGPAPPALAGRPLEEEPPEPTVVAWLGQEPAPGPPPDASSPGVW